MRALAGGFLAASAPLVGLHLAATAPGIVAAVVAACVFYTGGRIARPSANRER